MLTDVSLWCYDISTMPQQRETMPALSTITQTLETERSVMLYFGTPSCSVCHALRPKLFRAVEECFPKMLIQSIDTSSEPEAAAAFQVFGIPTVLIFFEGKEYLRKSRYMSVDAIIQTLTRPYALLYS